MSSPRPKLLIVAHHLRGYLGHYFETSVSVADAARRLGWHPVLATHVHCPQEILPEWLEKHPVFYTECADDCRPPDDPFAAARPGLPLRAFRKATQTYWKLARAADRSLYHFFPPLFHDAGRLLAYCGVPRWAHLRHQGELHSAWRQRQQRRGALAEVVAQAEPWPEASRRLRGPRQAAKVIQAVGTLVPPGFGSELEQMLCFERDLLRFLALAQARRDDHVLVLSAHPRDAAAAPLALEILGPENSPTFHLEILNALFESDPAAELSTPPSYVRIKRLLMSLYGDWMAGDRVKLYTDSEMLSKDYESISGQPFGVLPIPFRAELLTPAPRPPSAAVRLGYFGEARDEKGFPWLSELAEALRDEYLGPGRARFVIQANISLPQYNPQSVAAFERLRRFPPSEVQLFAAGSALSAVEYYRMFSQADVVLLPYLNGRYRACTSGVLAEALALGSPVVAPAGTWMAEQLPPGVGETFTDFNSFVSAVKRVIDGFESHRRAAEAFRPMWRRRHSPDALVAALT
ncbi:MAG TPA: glycosyltransferase, partial [Pirellulales bacterium]|nr:glycosyltransferase [Pirellulales bacterium]